jgi:hypothetical protein
MASRAPVHVQPREDGWAVVREGNERTTSLHPTQAEAEKEGRDIARREETAFFLHAQDGSVREQISYGEAIPEEGTDLSEGNLQDQQQGGGAQDAVGQVTDQASQATQGVQDTAGQATDQAQGLVGGLTGGGQQQQGQEGQQQGGDQQQGQQGQ